MSELVNCARCKKQFTKEDLKPLSSRRLFYLELSGLGLPGDEAAKRYCEHCRRSLNGGLLFLAFIGIGAAIVWLVTALN